MSTVVEKRNTVEDVLVRHFVREDDGFWYPIAVGEALVRVALENGLYRVERKREGASTWVKLAEGLASDFDAESFDTWASNWPLVAAS